jgi:2-succinyl-5-enolpyruvyl-6-hydroxy-3-cyclohexene-1-carboxylate synthase
LALDFTNTNLLWTSILAETLYRLGLMTAVVCPGSRSGPLAIAFANHPTIEAIPVLDERSAAFFALGLARQQHRPVVLICTSGTAGANFYPAVIEAHESRVPLLVLTADRPPELRACNAGQAIDQHKLYGSFPNWHTELALPSFDPNLLAYLRQTLIHAWEKALYPVPGPVHLNLPLRDPLAPLPDPQTQAQALTFNPSPFFTALPPFPLSPTLPSPPTPTLSQTPLSSSLPPIISPSHHLPAPCPLPPFPPHGLIIAGPAQPQFPDQYCQAIAHLSQAIGYPVLAEALSPLRNYADQIPHLISTYDLILRNPALAQKMAPELVIRVGEMPTSKQLRTWLAASQPRQWVIDASDRNLDPLHGQTTHLRLSLESFAHSIPQPEQPVTSAYLDQWCSAERQTRSKLDQTMANVTDWFEGKVAWLLSQVLPPEIPLFVTSSMPVRDLEFFWAPGTSRISPYFNRGANGIDGSLSTAMGIAHRRASGVMLTGDLALLHDTNGFLLNQQFIGHLTIVLINNRGGGIFEMLPIARFEPPFETFFATPQFVDIAHLCAAYGVTYERMVTWEQLAQRLNPLPATGLRVLEICTNRKADAQWRQNNLGKFAENITF